MTVVDSVRRIRTHLALTTIHGLILLSSLVMYRVVASRFGAAGFAQLALAYRVLALLHPPLMLGMGIGLPRLVARLPENERDSVTPTYLLAALAPVWIASGLLCIVVALAAKSTSTLIFGSSREAPLVLALIPLLVGASMQGILYGYLRGRFASARANILLLVNMAIVQVVTALTQASIRSVLATTGLAWMAVSLAAALPVRKIQYSAVWPNAQRLLQFGLRRVPGEFAIFGLLSLPAMYVAHVRSLQDAGFFAFGTSIVVAAGSLMAPMSALALPAVSRLQEDRKNAEIRTYARTLLLVSVSVCGVGLIVLELTAPEALRFVLGRRFGLGASTIRWVGLGMLPYGVYTALRGVLDAAHVQALNMRNATKSLILMVMVAGILQLIKVHRAPEVGFLVGVYALGALTVWHSFSSIDSQETTPR